MVGAIELSPTESQEAAVGSAQRVVVARARAPRDAVVAYHCLEITLYSSRVYFRKMHHALRMRRSASMDMSALRMTLRNCKLFFLLFIPQEWATAVLVYYYI